MRCINSQHHHYKVISGSCSALARICNALLQINLVAVDFDMTMVDVHTGGRWQSGEAELAQRIRPFFRAFIPKAAEHGLHVAVVTFSEQVSCLKLQPWMF
jgi:hypothetical protein